ncbi:MAG TPA: hypothetical protein DIT04_05715 [Dysgonomonas sp.]|nr:hypothetical protein [Dysgonomonas sp.]
MKYTHIDIRLNDSTKLCCLLDETGKCKSSTFYLPEATDINDCVNLLNTHYLNDFIRRSWVYDGCSINIQHEQNHYRLLFYKDNPP